MSGISRIPSDKLYPELSAAEKRELRALEGIDPIADGPIIGSSTRCELHPTRRAVACLAGMAACRDCADAVQATRRAS